MGKRKKNRKGYKIRHIIYTVYYIFFFLELLFLSSKAMWVAIDCRSKNCVAVLKGLGSTGLYCKRQSIRKQSPVFRTFSNIIYMTGHEGANTKYKIIHLCISDVKITLTMYTVHAFIPARSQQNVQ
jgi:hypothetical protein